MSDYKHALEYEPWQVDEGKELVVKGSDDNHYLGEWVRNILSAQRDSHELALGHFEDPIRGDYEPATFPIDALYRHAAYVGVTGYGKSTALEHQMLQLAAQGYGFTFIDPKGDAVQSLAQKLPADRTDDVVYLAPGSDGPTVGFNFFQTVRTPDDDNYAMEVETLADQFVSLLQAGEEAWGPDTDEVIHELATALIRVAGTYTPRDMRAVLADPHQHEDLIDTLKPLVNDRVEDILASRELRSGDVPGMALERAIRRLDTWLEDDTLESLVADADGHAWGRLIRDERIVIVDTSELSSTGETVAATLARGYWAEKYTAVRKTAPTPHFLHIDEADLLCGDAFPLEDMLGKGRSVKLSLSLAFQQLHAFPEDRQDLILGQMGTLFGFNIATASEAGKLGQCFGIGGNRLQELSPYTFVGRLYRENGGRTDALEISLFAPRRPTRNPAMAAELLEDARTQFATDASV